MSRLVPFLSMLALGLINPVQAGSPKFFFGSTAQNVAEIVERVVLAEISAPFLYVPPGSAKCERDAILVEPCRLVSKIEHTLEHPAEPKRRTLIVRVNLSRFGSCSGVKERIAELARDPQNLAKYIDERGERYTGSFRLGFDGHNNQFNPKRPNSSFNLSLLTKGKFEEVDCSSMMVRFTLPLGGQMLL
jgi:hypothetical protein